MYLTNACHNMHNVTRKFLLPFDKYKEYFLNDLHNYFKWSYDLRHYLSETGNDLEIKCLLPPDYIDHCWVPTCDIIEVNLCHLPAQYFTTRVRERLQSVSLRYL